MTRPAQHCDECKHHLERKDGERWGVACALGHKPRFYLPQTMDHAHKGSCGWKRRCGDFQAATGVKP